MKKKKKAPTPKTRVSADRQIQQDVRTLVKNMRSGHTILMAVTKEIQAQQQEVTRLIAVIRDQLAAPLLTPVEKLAMASRLLSEANSEAQSDKPTDAPA